MGPKTFISASKKQEAYGYYMVFLDQKPSFLMSRERQVSCFHARGNLKVEKKRKKNALEPSPAREEAYWIASRNLHVG
jgi:hypothetical protein